MTKLELPTQPALPFNAEVLANPSQDQLRELALEHTPFCFKTSYGSVCKVARNKSRLAQLTYVIDRRNEGAAAYSAKTIAPADAQVALDGQAKYINEKGKLIAIEGYVGLGEYAVPVQWLYTLEGANIAAMQQILAFPREAVETAEQLAQPFKPAFRLVYTPDFRPELPGKQGIIADLDNYVTYVMGADYFGESKKGALRMLCALIYRQGGLVMHAGAKAIEKDGAAQTMAVLGLSGTGKTTTTFSKQGDNVFPIQDDMIALWPGGSISITENGCFAKTQALTEEAEPIIYRGTISPSAWIENVYVEADGTPNFDKGKLSPEDVARLKDVLIGTGAPADNVAKYISGEVTIDQVLDANGVPNDGWDFVSWSENGRSIVPMAAIENAADLHNVPTMRSLGILNRDEGADAATPGIVRFSNPNQAAAYFMLGETTKTSAAGKDRGKTRSPFTQPFFPLTHSSQAKRFSELATTFPSTTMWLMNTGYIGGSVPQIATGEAQKIKIRHSSAMLEALISEKIVWTQDPDFGYEIVDVNAPENKALVEAVGTDILNPKSFYERTGRMDVYNKWVADMTEQRQAFLRSHSVDDAIVNAVRI